VSVWASVDDVTSRLTYGEIGDDTTPNTVDVQAWLDEAEALTRGTLRAVKLGVDYSSGSDAELILRTHVVDYALAWIKRTWASADGTGENEDGQAEAQAFSDRLADIEQRPAAWGARLSSTGASPTSARTARSHVTTGLQTSTAIYEIGKRDRVL